MLLIGMMTSPRVLHFANILNKFIIPLTCSFSRCTSLYMRIPILNIPSYSCHTFILMHAHKHAFSCTYTHSLTYSHTHIDAHIHIYTHLFTYTHTHLHTPTHTLTYTTQRNKNPYILQAMDRNHQGVISFREMQESLEIAQVGRLPFLVEH